MVSCAHIKQLILFSQQHKHSHGGVNRPESLTVLMRMSSVPSVWTMALEELDIRRPSGAIQWIMGSGSPLALQRRVTL